MRFALPLLTGLGLSLAVSLVTPRAEACGGCFPPPGEQSSVVTDHRMILAVSKTQTTLYDQIQYQGSPSEFAWVLPISGTVDVGLSADSLFNALHTLSAVTVLEPPRNCPPPPQCPSPEGAFGAASPGGSSDAGAAVDVLKREVVGPYETVQLKSDDALALENWLTQNGFNVPADIKPIIKQYVAEKFNFLALRLRPGQGTQSMRPVRVTTQGASAVLPLRMVAAGTGANVGITLWVVGEGRYEPQNFQSFVIRDEDLVWDWNVGSSNYRDLRAQRSATQPGKMWEIESSNPTFRQQIESAVLSGGFVPGRPPPGAGGDYLPIEDENGLETKSAETVRNEDLATVFAGIAAGREHLTRMRADLSRAALATDLSVIASLDQAAIPVLRNPKGEIGQPLCPIFDGDCRQTGTLPRDQAEARASEGDGTFTCQTGSSRGGLGGAGAIGAFVALAMARAVRDRRRAR
ncbi:MAG: DUF2330 domain-containing protein [Labilithrix sp.]|nr:DUF2330 domain-containing protein [Labilithrix sp.]